MLSKPALVYSKPVMPVIAAEPRTFSSRSVTEMEVPVGISKYLMLFVSSFSEIPDKKAIAEKAFGFPYRCVEDWIHCLSDLRNMCAHYNRLYANTLDNIPKQPPNITRALSNTLYDYLIILKQLYPRDETWRTTFIMRLEMLIMEYSDVIELQHIGFPENWRDELI